MNYLPEYTKDGIHLIIGCRVDREEQKEIRKLVLATKLVNFQAIDEFMGRCH